MNGKILIVEDDAAIAALYERVLASNGFDVHVASNGKQALSNVGEHRFDVIVSDIAMPEMDGVQFLERLRLSDEVVPVVFLTGQPEVETVQRAIELRAFRYLVKPVGLSALVASVRRAASCCRWLRARQDAATVLNPTPTVELDPSAPAAHFEDALKLLRVHFQPVVDTRSRQLRGFRALARSLHPLLSTFDDLLREADRLGRRPALRRKLWSLTTAPLEFLDKALLLFVWTDVAGLEDALEHPDLTQYAGQTVLVASDRQGIDDGVRARHTLEQLRARGYRLGVDQLGDGYAGLNALAWLEPEFLDLELALVRAIGANQAQRRVVETLGNLARDLGATLSAEGVADEAGARLLAELGCEIFSWDPATSPDELSPTFVAAVPALGRAASA